MRLLLRLQFLLLALFLLLLGLTLSMGSVQAGTGILVFDGGVGYNNRAYEVFVDYDSEMLLLQAAPELAIRQTAYARVVGRNLDSANLYFYRGQDFFLVPLEQHIRPVAAIWNESRGQILLAHADGENALLSWVHPFTAELSPFAIYENFKLGFGAISPDGRYIMLREDGQISPIPLPKPMLLVNSQTGSALDFGSPTFAYWSPNSQYLALGYKAIGRYESRIERYEIATGARLAYPVVASQEDTPFFYDNGFRSNGILWSPNSQNLVVLNRDTETLHFLNADGSVMNVEGGRITPLRWSPDSRFLLGIGYSNGEIGAFIVDTTNGSIQHIESPVVLQDALSDFAWSPNSRYVAVLTHSSGILYEHRLIVYTTDGQIFGRPVALSAGERFATMDGTLRWLD